MKNRAADTHQALSVNLRCADDIAFEPIEVAEDLYTGIAFELNRNAEGIDLARPAASPVASLARSETVPAAEILELDLPDSALRDATDEDVVDLSSSAGAAEPCVGG